MSVLYGQTVLGFGIYNTYRYSPMKTSFEPYMETSCVSSSSPARFLPLEDAASEATGSGSHLSQFVFFCF